jgi:hypothetical protein
MKRKWAIVGYHVGQRPGRDYIQSSIGYPYAKLKTIAKRMNSNGEGQRYAVVRYYETSYAEELELSIAFQEAGMDG